MLHAQQSGAVFVI